MKYSIAFRGLPFEPEKRQVIYVENLYDERINAIIRDIYEQLKWTFKRANLDFIYLPMFFNDEETKEKILYYAPYLTSEIIENAELRNNYLLSYMSNLGNREKIGPSLIYAPQKEDDEWIFQGQSIDLDEKNKNSFLRIIEDLIAEDFGAIGTPEREQFDMECDAFIIGEQLKDERLRAGLTQEQLADKIGTKKSFISRVERGHTDIQLSTLVKLFQGLGRKVSVRVI